MLKRLMAIALFAGLPLVAQAGSFEINPVVLALSASHPSDTITVHNTGITPVVVQAELSGWSQENGENTYAPSRDLVATPPIFTIAPGGQQLVRIGLRNPAAPTHEMSYALFLAEVPSSHKQGVGLQIALRIGMPVFVEPEGDLKPDLHWSVKLGTGGKLAVTAANTGTGHLQITGFKLGVSTDKDPLVQSSAGYVLAGKSRTWIVKPSHLPAAGAVLQLTADTENGAVSAQVTVQN